ncbi:hypothetical protein, partial [Xanthomonas vasicola]|uniref:hypothetical protein n=1 Tax=Xanthomonas vasicola TaxID=56459 RepID=UPI001C1222DA
MQKKQANSARLKERITESMQRDIGVTESMAKPFVESVMRCLAGEQHYFPAFKREYPVQEIRRSLESGKNVAYVLCTFDLSRSKLHELFPGGLPKPTQTFQH